MTSPRIRRIVREREGVYGITPKGLVSLRCAELHDALDKLAAHMPPADDTCGAQTIQRLRARHATVGRAIDQLGAAVATRDGYDCAQSVGPDVALPIGGQGR